MNPNDSRARYASAMQYFATGGLVTPFGDSPSNLPASQMPADNSTYFGQPINPLGKANYNQDPGFLGLNGPYQVQTYSQDANAYKIPGFNGIQNAYQGLAQNGATRYDQGVDQQQTGLADALTAQANGQGPSLAQIQLQMGTDQSLANASALAASQQGNGAAGSERELAYNQGAISQQGAQQAAALRMQEQMQARGQLAGVLGQQRQQDLGVSSLDSQTQLGALGGAASNAQAQQGAYGQQQALGSQISNNQNTQGQGAYNNGVATQSKAIGTISNAAGSVIGAALPVPKFAGGSIPGRAMHPGNSPMNDTVPAMLSPGEVVIPRTAASDPEKAKAFVAAMMAQRGKR